MGIFILKDRREGTLLPAEPGSSGGTNSGWNSDGPGFKSWLGPVFLVPSFLNWLLLNVGIITRIKFESTANILAATIIFIVASLFCCYYCHQSSFPSQRKGSANTS